MRYNCFQDFFYKFRQKSLRNLYKFVEYRIKTNNIKLKIRWRSIFFSYQSIRIFDFWNEQDSFQNSLKGISIFYPKFMCFKFKTMKSRNYLKLGKNKKNLLSCYFQSQYVSLTAGSFVFAEGLIFEWFSRAQKLSVVKSGARLWKR